jgi:hypothetical protein
MESIESYFSREDTPGVESAVGNLMVKILAKYPDFDFERARTEARALLDKAAGAKRYVAPRVFSPEEKSAREEKFRLFRANQLAA